MPTTHRPVQLPIEELVDNWWNPNEMPPDKFNALADSMQEHGLLEFIQVAPLNDELRAAFEAEGLVDYAREAADRISQGKRWLVLQGSHRFQVAEVLGWKTIGAVVLPPDDVYALMGLSVRMNRVRGDTTNVEKNTALYEMLLNKGYTELEAMSRLGITSRKELQSLIKQVTRDLDPELRKEFEARREEIKTIEDLGRVLNELFTRYGQDLDYGFMVFTYGGKAHTYIPPRDKEESELVSRWKEYCRQERVDIRDTLKWMLRNFLVSVRGEAMNWPEPRASDLGIAE